MQREEGQDGSMGQHWTEESAVNFPSPAGVCFFKWPRLFPNLNHMFIIITMTVTMSDFRLVILTYLPHTYQSVLKRSVIVYSVNEVVATSRLVLDQSVVV